MFLLTVALAAALAGCGPSNGSIREVAITAAVSAAGVTRDSCSPAGESGADTPELPAGVDAPRLRGQRPWKSSGLLWRRTRC